MRDSAEEVAQQIAGSRLRSDVKDDPVEMDYETEKVQVERPKLEVQDLT
jgi:hypothetical protein